MSDTFTSVFTATHTGFIDGPAGRIEVRVDVPTMTPRGVAVVAHPQPLLGGSPRHPIPHRWSQGLCREGWLVVRPSFRGVGGTQGVYDHGDGESADLMTVCARLTQAWPGLPLALLGFSFGAYVAARVGATLVQADTPPAAMVLAGLPVGDVPAGRHYATPPVPAGTLLLHGEKDAEAPLANVLAWARVSGLPVTVMPGADHVFAGSQPWLVSQVLAYLRQV